jgi:hypothetical protein
VGLLAPVAVEVFVRVGVDPDLALVGHPFEPCVERLIGRRLRARRLFEQAKKVG